MSKSSKIEQKAEAKTTKVEPKTTPEAQPKAQSKPTTKTELAITDPKVTPMTEEAKTIPATEPKSTPITEEPKTGPKTTMSAEPSSVSSQDAADNKAPASLKKLLPEVPTTASADKKPSALNASDPVKRESQAENQQPSNPVPPVNEAADSPAPQPKFMRYRKPNYVKYDKNKKVLVDLLRTGNHSSAFIGHRANIASNSTLFKYQSLASNETGLLLMSKEELEFIRSNCPADKVAKIDDRLRDQNKGWKDRYEEAAREFEAQSKL